MIIQPSTRNNPSQPICECGQKVGLTIHHDFIEGHCPCGKEYQIKLDGSVWNCCAKPANT